ncbi:MAG: hypothetical protein LC105_00175 [Chitinophagales bacterium]|nr:hypothetical protein [Chitinophagales bacterium]MCZ2392260.1 hypothetical protein [Chitinophagales bacterium]
MNKLKVTFSIFLLALFISSISFYSCKKESAESSKSDSTWSIDNYQFTANNNGGILIVSDTGSLFGATDKSKNTILILFKNSPQPGVYQVVNSLTKTSSAMYNNDDCSMMITNKAVNNSVFLSILDSAGVVNISKEGSKLKAVFSNVKLGIVDKVSASIVPAYASGVIVEK